MNFQNRKTRAAGVRLGLLLATILAGQVAAAAQPRKLIIDCDPGIDDAIAIILAMQYPGFDIIGITTTFGNASLEQATKNALRIVELSGKSIPVYKGASKPWIAPLRPPPDFVHGQDGLGNTLWQSIVSDFRKRSNPLCWVTSGRSSRYEPSV